MWCVGRLPTYDGVRSQRSNYFLGVGMADAIFDTKAKRLDAIFFLLPLSGFKVGSKRLDSLSIHSVNPLRVPGYPVGTVMPIRFMWFTISRSIGSVPPRWSISPAFCLVSPIALSLGWVHMFQP
jgi:hypothetical protein